MHDNKAQSLLAVHSDEIQTLLVLEGRDADFALVASPFVHLLSQGVEHRDAVEVCTAYRQDIVGRIGIQCPGRVVFIGAVFYAVVRLQPVLLHSVDDIL